MADKDLANAVHNALDEANAAMQAAAEAGLTIDLAIIDPKKIGAPKGAPMLTAKIKRVTVTDY